jgi:hypothetical protein
MENKKEEENQPSQIFKQALRNNKQFHGLHSAAIFRT